MNLHRKDRVDGCPLFGAEMAVFQHANRIVELRGFTGANQYRSDFLIAQHPGQRHLRKLLSAGFGQRVQLANFFQFAFGKLIRLQEPATAGGAGVSRNAVQVTVG